MKAFTIASCLLFLAFGGCKAEVVTQAVCSKAADAEEFNVYLDYALNITGDWGTLDYKISFLDKETGEPISPWHDIPLGLEGNAKDGYYIWVVNEIPRGDLAKMETMVRFPPQNAILTKLSARTCWMLRWMCVCTEQERLQPDSTR